MRISSLMGLGREALKFSAAIVVAVFIVWIITHRLICKTALHGQRKLSGQKRLSGQKNLSAKKMFSYGLLMVIILVIVYVTILRGRYGGGRPELIPFSSYKMAWYEFNAAGWRNLILNICMFIPFGFMLPAASEKCRKAQTTYLAGFVFTLLIEVLQLVLKRGIFETDDLINNVLGTMIGYGFFSIASALANACIKARTDEKFSHKKSLHKNLSDNALSNKKSSDRKTLKRIMLLQIPLLLAILSFVLIFTIYDRKELGNMIYENISGHTMPEVSVSAGVELSSEELTSNIYQMEVASVEETRQLAGEIFARQGTAIDEGNTDIYDDTAVYYSEEGGLNLWIDYKGSTVRYTNFDLSYPTDGTKCDYLIGADEQTVRKAVEKIGFTVPEQVSYAAGEDGRYIFEADVVLPDKRYCAGTVICRLNGQGEVTDMDYNIVINEFYRETALISSREAYDLLCSGRFCCMDSVPDDLPLTVTDMEIVYFADTKGFCQPLYRFVLDNGDGEELLQIDIPARKT